MLAAQSVPTGAPSEGWQAKAGARARVIFASDVASWLASTAIHAGVMIGLSLLVLGRIAEPREKLEAMFAEMPSNYSAELPGDAPINLDSASDKLETGLPDGGGEPLELPGPHAANYGLADGAGSLLGGEPMLAAEAGTTGSPSEFALDSGTATSLEGIGVGFSDLDNPLAPRGGGLEGRRLVGRLGTALRGGGSVQSEAAVEAGLAWLARHQWSDGGWRFDLTKCPACGGACKDSGFHESTTAATGLALLSFLGAGYTHDEGKYQDNVARGLRFLRSRMNVTKYGGDLRDGGRGDDVGRPFFGRRGGMANVADTMYSHGIASLALTEAYGMSHDPDLRPPAQQAIEFIINSQYEDGGWRYIPAMFYPGPGDMTVTGWQMSALKSALLAGIEIPPEVWRRAGAFVEGLELDDGATYSYVRGERGTASTTAIGLLCRMIGGWPRQTPSLLRGANHIGDLVPSQGNMYFNFYASQVLHHLGGPLWNRWNPQMRDYLVATQATDGHERGSWYFNESHSGPGGRLYTTAMAVMTLEVYYRYMPLYGEQFVDKKPVAETKVRAGKAPD